nr:MAG TPA: hypothetical protein [Microviridae sp.]
MDEQKRPAPKIVDKHRKEVYIMSVPTTHLS